MNGFTRIICSPVSQHESLDVPLRAILSRPLTVPGPYVPKFHLFTFSPEPVLSCAGEPDQYPAILQGIRQSLCNRAQVGKALSERKILDTQDSLPFERDFDIRLVKRLARQVISHIGPHPERVSRRRIHRLLRVGDPPQCCRNGMFHIRRTVRDLSVCGAAIQRVNPVRDFRKIEAESVRNKVTFHRIRHSFRVDGGLTGRECDNCLANILSDNPHLPLRSAY